MEISDDDLARRIAILERQFSSWRGLGAREWCFRGVLMASLVVVAPAAGNQLFAQLHTGPWLR